MLTRLLRTLFGKTRSPDAAVDSAADAAARGDQALAAGDYTTAKRCYESALAADPGMAHALLNLGMACAMSQDFDRAAAHFEKLLELDPDAAAAHLNLGNIALSSGRLGAAVRHYQAAQAASPSNPGLINNLGMALLRQGLPERAMECFRAVLQIQPDHADAAENLLFAMQHAPSVTPAELFEEFRRWARTHEEPLLALQQPHANTPDPERTLRIGYVSGDFFGHAVANFIEPVLASHERGAFEIFGYYTREYADWRTAALRGLSDHWQEIAGLTDAAAAARIRADGIDILVDLSAHTQGNRLGIFARKPAPVQMTYLGYPATTGMQSIDYRISDALADPPGIAERFHTERLLRLPQSQWCYRPAQVAPPVGKLPALRTGRVTFGSFNNPAKLNEYILSVWAQVLQGLPQSVLTVTSVSDPETRQRIAGTLVRHGARPDQVRVLGRLDDAEFWRIREDIDLVLDAFPYNGTTTTCEALWAGLPVITLAGTLGAARTTASLLHAVGLAQLIAQDAAQFVAIAQDLAGNLDRLAALRQGMRHRMTGLCDSGRFARELEALYRTAWRAWCEGRA